MTDGILRSPANAPVQAAIQPEWLRAVTILQYLQKEDKGRCGVL